MTVSTFGSPKVGNGRFRKVYDSLVPRHWRVELAPDIITRLPLPPYQHVGKQVLLTDAAALFLDPIHLDMHMQQQKSTNIAYHRKVSRNEIKSSSQSSTMDKKCRR